MTDGPFDPVYERRLMLEVALPFGGATFAPKGLPAYATPQKAAVCVDLLLQCYWIGLVAEAKPRLEAIVDWMQQHAPPDPAHYNRDQNKWLDVFYDHYSWWRTLGLATWLLDRGEGPRNSGRAWMSNWTPGGSLCPIAWRIGGNRCSTTCLNT